MSEQEASLDDTTDPSRVVRGDKPRLITGVSWSKIEYLPDDWEATNLESEISITTGGNFSSDDFTEEEGVPLIRIRDLGAGTTTVNYTGECDEKYLVRDYDLLVGMDGEFEPHLWSGGRSLLNQRVCRIEPKQTYNKIFLRYAIQKPLWYIQKSIAGTTVKHLSQYNIRDINLPTPPLEEQRKIASVLYTVDQAIEKTNQIVEQGERVQKGVIQENILNKISKASSPTELGEVPDDWRKVQLEDVASEEEDSLVDGPFGSSLKADKFVEDGFARIIQLQNVKEGWYSDSNIRYVDEQTYEELERHSAKPGDLFIAKMASPVARTCILPDKYDQYMLGCADVVKLTPNDEFIDEFVMYCLNSYPVWKQAAAHIRGSGRLRVNLNQLKEVELPKPPLSEQKQIVDAVNGITDYVDSDKKEKERLQRLKRGLMQDLLSGEVRTYDTDIDILDDVLQHG